MITVHLTQDRVALIDDADWPRVQKYRWHLHVSKRGNSKNYYARATIGGWKVYLHRFLVEAPAEMDVDHVDGDGLNCQRDNLEIVTPLENARRRDQRKLENEGSGQAC